MSYYSTNIERNSSQRSTGNSLPVQTRRERDKIRRQQQSATQESVEKPKFPQPRKIAARQDSVTRKITDVLGDSGVVSELLFREPRIYLGTSRSSQGQTVAQEDTGVVSPSATMQKTGAAEYLQPRPIIRRKDGSLSHSSGDRIKAKASRSSGHEQTVQSHSMHGAQQFSSLKSDYVHLLPNHMSEISGTHGCHNEDPTFSALKRPGRDRVSSGDSEMFFGVETILKEMVVDLSPSITGIKTPSVNEIKFNFASSAQKRKLDGPENSLESTNSDAMDCNAGSDDSSGDDSSDDDTNGNVSNPDEDNGAKNTGWNLVDLMPQNTTSNPARDNLDMENSQTHPCEKATKKRNNINSQSRKAVLRDPTHKVRSPKSRPHSSSDLLCNSPQPHGSDAIDIYCKLKPSKHGGSKITKDADTVRQKSAHRVNKHGHSKMSLTIVPSKESEQNRDGYPNRNPSRGRRTSSAVNSNSSSTLCLSSDSPSSDNEDFSNYESSNSPVSSQELSRVSNEESVRQPISSNTQRDSRSQYAHRNDNWTSAKKDFTGERSKFVRRNLASSRSGDKMFSKNDNRRSCAYGGYPAKKNVAHHHVERNLFPSLYVRFKSSLFLDGLASTSHSPIKNENEPVVPQKRQATMSTGSETDQPVRRTTCVQVAVADGSTDWKEEFTSSKHVFASSETEQLHYPKRPGKKSLRKRDDELFAIEGFRAPIETKCRDTPASPIENSNAHASNSLRGQNSSNFSQKRSGTPAPKPPIVLPDSSVTGEQERIQTSDWYMREGKKKKREGDDGMLDLRTGRTRTSEAMNPALSYFEASLYFIMSGFVMESENREDRLESAGSNSSSSTSHCPANMYQETLEFLEFVLKMRPRAEQDDKTFKRITLSCLRCQSFLYFRIFKLKKDVALKYSEVLTEQFKTMDKSVQTHSAWHSTNIAPNVVSPMSPAVPSPYTHHGPSPASNNGEQVTSSTQAGRMTPTSHSGYSFPQKTYDMYRRNHTIMCNALHAFEKWDQAEAMLEEHANFFHNIDALCNRTLTFHSCLREVFLYNKMVLRQLRALMNGSPST